VKLTISVISGFDEGKRQSFTDFPISIGRLPDNDFQLKDPFVSRRHCTIYKDQNYFTLSDLKSTNKTVLNGKILKAPVTVKKADRLGLGSNLIEIDWRL
jgi:pSer/pThr/pTyr-binding forkhead associated (FHA) protein